MPKTIEYYLAKGLDRKMAEYFAAGKRTIASVVPNDDFSLSITFDNGEIRRLDMRPYLKKGTVFEPFMDIRNFRRVYVDAQHAISWDIDPNIDSEIIWSNKVDLCPDSCYIDSIAL